MTNRTTVTTPAGAVALERQRISEIMESPEGLLRPQAARKLALSTSMDATTAIEFLKSIPADNPYLAAMEAQGPVNIGGPNVGATMTTDAKAARIAEIKENVRHYNLSKGRAKPE